MAELRCMDYGFECDYVASGDDEAVIREFRGHMESEHGIEYSKEAVMQFLRRKQG